MVNVKCVSWESVVRVGRTGCKVTGNLHLILRHDFSLFTSRPGTGLAVCSQILKSCAMPRLEKDKVKTLFKG